MGWDGSHAPRRVFQTSYLNNRLHVSVVPDYIGTNDSGVVLCDHCVRMEQGAGTFLGLGTPREMTWGLNKE